MLVREWKNARRYIAIPPQQSSIIDSCSLICKQHFMYVLIGGLFLQLSTDIMTNNANLRSRPVPRIYVSMGGYFPMSASLYKHMFLNGHGIFIPPGGSCAYPNYFFVVVYVVGS